MRPSTPDSSSVSLVFQSTHSLRSATEKPGQRIRAAPGFNPRTPCGVRLLNAGFVPLKALFQSTHSLRSATVLVAQAADGIAGFNPRTPCGVRQVRKDPELELVAFQSTHSLRSATTVYGIHLFAKLVSIHALLAECDLRENSRLRKRRGFNPRTPCGVRPYAMSGQFKDPRFQSTHSLRSATGTLPGNGQGARFQSTHSLRSATLFRPIEDSAIEGFQSTHSLRSATAPDLIHCYSTEQIILCANLPKKTVIAQLLFLSIYLSIFYSQCITPIADLPGNSCELEVGAQAMFNSL